jgi:hypothetical protein
MSRFIECHFEGRKVYINAFEVNGIVDNGNYRSIYGGGIGIPYLVDESIEDLYRMICGGEPEEQKADSRGIKIGDEVGVDMMVGRFVVICDLETKYRLVGESGTIYAVPKWKCDRTGRHFAGFENAADSLNMAMDEWKGAEE